MSTTVTMPQLGETVTEGTVLRWAKKVGDHVSEDEVLVEISTDKVDTEIPSPASGVLAEILVGEGDTVGVGSPLCVISDVAVAPRPVPATGTEPPVSTPVSPPAEPAVPTPPSLAPEAAPPSPVPSLGEPGELVRAPAASERTDTEGRLLSPVVRKLARENEIDVSAIDGTGAGGRVTRSDVEAVIASRQAEPPVEPGTETPPQPRAEPGVEAPSVVAPAAPTPAPPVSEALALSAETPVEAGLRPGDEIVDLERLRVRIAENMHRSRQSTAHVWTSVEVDFERVERVRAAQRESFRLEEGFSLTYLPFIARATIDALREYPIVNSSLYLEERKAVYHRAVHLGIAVDLDQKGLLAVSVRDADGLRLVGLARRIRALAEKARAGKLEPDDVAGATFTITNPGPYGSFMSAPIINVPNVGILSTDTVTKRPVVVTGADGDDVIAIRHIGYLGLSWDHRAFDGSTAVLFLRRIKENLETWDWEQELA